MPVLDASMFNCAMSEQVKPMYVFTPHGSRVATMHLSFFFFFNDTATTEIYTLSLHDALPIYAFLRTLTNRLRIERDQPVEALAREGERLPALARRLGYHGTNAEVAQRLVNDYERHTARVQIGRAHV